MPSNRDEGHLLFDIRQNKYTINQEEQKILQKIFDSIKLDAPQTQQITLNPNEFIADPAHGYAALAKKFKQKIEAIEAYNLEIEKNHPWKNFFGMVFKKDSTPLKVALTFINKHTHSLITLNNVDTAVNYSRNENKKYAHKIYTYSDNTVYQFTAKNLLTTLTHYSKKFLFWAYGPIAELKNAFNKKVERARKDRKNFQIIKNKENILQNIQSNPDSSVLTQFHRDTTTRRGIIQHYELQDAINMPASQYVTNMSEYKKIKTLFNDDLANYENKHVLINNDKPIFKYIAHAKEIIRILSEIIQQANEANNLLKQQLNNNVVGREPITDQDIEFFNNIIANCTKDIKAIKVFSGPYTKYTIFSDNYVNTEQKQQLYKEDIITLAAPADRSVLRVV